MKGPGKFTELKPKEGLAALYDWEGWIGMRRTCVDRYKDLS